MHRHFKFFPFWHHRKDTNEEQGQLGCFNQHLLGNGEKPTCDTLKY